jgi:pSer/pThr/pTyr-binding forkhead associated (FHA) protein
MQVVLVMFRGDGERRSFSIVRDVTVIGRREDCDFRIPLGEISRKHCRLIKDGESLRAEDLGSSNGTYVNGARVQEAELSPGDTLKVGSVVFVVQIDGVPAEDDMQPAIESLSDTGLTMTPAGEEGEMSGPTEIEAHDPEMSGEEGDQPTVDDQPPTDEPVAEDGSQQYDPMAILGAADDSSLGSSMDSERIADELISELESHEKHRPKQED